MNDERKTELAQLINEATQHRLSMTEALVLIDKLADGGWLAPEDNEDDPAVDGPEFDAAVDAEVARSEKTNTPFISGIQPHPIATGAMHVDPVMEGDDVPDEDAVV
jgi:hypothetical protein